MHEYVAVERCLDGDHCLFRLFDGHKEWRVGRGRRRRHFDIALNSAFASFAGQRATVASVMVAPPELLATPF